MNKGHYTYSDSYDVLARLLRGCTRSFATISFVFRVSVKVAIEHRNDLLTNTP
jgi:hypothetical protein